MGGATFASGPNALSTPRMPPRVYHATKARVHRALLDLYLCIASPIDGPGKADFGDIDIVLAWPRESTLGLPPGDEFDEIGRALGAERTIRETGLRAAHYAIPWPSHLHLGNQDGDGDGDGGRHIQVDVHICGTLRAFQWALFKHAHGDLWNILGSTIRPLGLTVDDTALWIRVPEVEAVDRKRARVKVTDDPVEVLRVLGLEVGSFWEESFESVEGLYEYAATSHMFWVRPLGEGEGEEQGEGGEGRAREDKRALRANDRRRMSMRPCYRGFVESFLPRCRAENRFTTQHHTRASVASLIFSRFPVQKEFEERQRAFEIELQRNDISRNKIKGFVDGLGIEDSERGRTYRGCLVKALKRIVLEGDGRYGVLPEVRGGDGRFVMERVVRFVEGSWRDVGEAALRIHDEDYREMLERKKMVEGKGGVDGEGEGGSSG